MQKLLVPLFFALLLASCGSNSDSPTITIAPEDEYDSLSAAYEYEMDTEDEAYVSPPLNIDSTGPLAALIGFPTEWERLERVNQIWVLPEPCNGSNPAFTLTQEEDSTIILTYYFGEVALPYIVIACTKEESRKVVPVYSFVLNAAFTESGTELVELAVEYDGSPKATWEFADTDNTMLFTPIEQSANFPIVKESCLLCFEDPCEWEKDWHAGFGIGVVKFNSTVGDKIELFAEQGATAPVKSLEITEDFMSGNTMAPEWFSPLVNYPEYELMHFVCQEKNNGWYKVVFDESTGETFWMAPNKHSSFMVWEDYVLTSLSISRWEQLRNPLRPTPGYSGEIIPYEYEYDCFVPIRVVGDWVEVEYGDFCTPEEAPFERAWFLWRDQISTVVDFAWVM